MACEFLYDEDGNVIAITCGSPWGIGFYWFDDDQSEGVYGFPPKFHNPHNFSPDFECCTEQEISNWEEAKKNWDERVIK